jgi:hypothetical protein
LKRTCPARIDLSNEILIWRLPCQRLEDTLCHGRPADVYETNEEHRELVRHCIGQIGMQEGAWKRNEKSILVERQTPIQKITENRTNRGEFTEGH